MLSGNGVVSGKKLVHRFKLQSLGYVLNVCTESNNLVHRTADLVWLMVISMDQTVEGTYLMLLTKVPIHGHQSIAPYYTVHAN